MASVSTHSSFFVNRATATGWSERKLQRWFEKANTLIRRVLFQSISNPHRGQRLVIHLKALNQFIQKQHFKMEGIHNLRTRDWLGLKNTILQYQSMPTIGHTSGLCSNGKPINSHVSSSGFLGVYQNTEPAITLLRQKSVRLIAYTDDLLLIAEMFIDHLNGTVYLLGVHNKSEESTFTQAQSMEFLAFTVDSLAMELRLPFIKMKHIRGGWKIGTFRNSISSCTSMLTDKCNKQCPSPASFFCCQLQMTLTSTLETLTMLQNTSHSYPGVPTRAGMVEPQYFYVVNPHITLDGKTTCKLCFTHCMSVNPCWALALVNI